MINILNTNSLYNVDELFNDEKIRVMVIEQLEKVFKLSKNEKEKLDKM